jgi:hypothetical protein
VLLRRLDVFCGQAAVLEFHHESVVADQVTRAILPACSGWRRAANLKNDRIAASLALRVRAVLPRSASRWARKPLTSPASMAAMSRPAGAVPVFSRA